MNNFLFLLFFLGGVLGIYKLDSSSGSAAFFVPTLLVIVYGMFILLQLKRVKDADLADHYTETIYFMGFLYTLVSLAVLFYRFSSGYFKLSGKDQIAGVFYYIGISVTTSIAGVLLRNLIRAHYLIRHPQDTGELEKSYNLLKEIAGSFAGSYNETFEMIKVYMEERKENTAVFNEKEKEYLVSLDTFTRVTKDFCRNLEETQGVLRSAAGSLNEVLLTQTESIGSLNEWSRQLADTTADITGRLELIPMESAAETIQTLAKETGELNAVVDSIVSILDSRIEKVQV